MIIKSMSRKVPSFGQLIGYIDRDEGNEQYTMRHNLMGRDQELMQSEFEANSSLLQKRKNGVYLYHEIISITRADGLDAAGQKDRLYDIAQTYVDARCPDNMVFGGLHEDKDHSYHMHLMISANRAGDAKRLRLTKAQFREIQIQTERHVLEKYPELEQKVAIEKQSDRGRKNNEAELERRTGRRPKREEVLDRVGSAFEASQDKQSLLDALGRENLELYVRGKNIGVIDHESGKKHRLKTLDLEMADRIAIRMSGEDQEKDDAPEIEPEIEDDRVQKTEPSGPDRVEPEQEMEPDAERDGQGERDVAGEKEKDVEKEVEGARRSHVDEKKREQEQRRLEKERRQRADKQRQRDADSERKKARKSDPDREDGKPKTRRRKADDRGRSAKRSDRVAYQQPDQSNVAETGAPKETEQSRGNPLFSFGKRVVDTVMTTTKAAMHELEEAGKIARQGLTGQDEDIGQSKAEKAEADEREFGEAQPDPHQDAKDRKAEFIKQKREEAQERGEQRDPEDRERSPQQEAWRTEARDRQNPGRDDGDRER